MARAQRGNEDLRRLLRLLMNERTELRPRDENRTFFEEFKSNIEAIKKNHYRPEETRRREPEKVGPEEKMENKNEKSDLSMETRGTRGRDMLLLKLERQSISIETLEAEVRKLRLQNQQLRETNHGLSSIVEREKRARETAEREVLKVQKALRVQAAQAAQEARAAQARRPQEVHFSWPEKQPDSPQKSESAEAIHQLRTGLALVHQRHEEAKRKWEASVAISAFQERVIRDLKAKLGQKGQPPLDLTEELLRGCEFDSCDDRADTTQLILGRPRGSAFDHLGPSPGEGHSRFKAAALAVLFTVRVQRAVAGRK